MAMRISAILLLAIFQVHAMNLTMEVRCQCAHNTSAITQGDIGNSSATCHSSPAAAKAVKIKTAVKKSSSCCPSEQDPSTELPSGPEKDTHQDCCCGCEEFMGVGAVVALVLEKEECAFQDAYSTFEFIMQEGTRLGRTNSRVGSARAPPQRA